MEEFDADASRLTRVEAAGHLKRKGHALAGYYQGEGFERHLIRTCCGES